MMFSGAAHREPPNGRIERMFVVLDLETTGADFRSPTQGGDRYHVAEVAAIALKADGSEHVRYGTTVRVPVARANGMLTDLGTRWHGITWSEVASAPTWSEVASDLAAMMNGATVIGHNVERFDIPFVTAAAARVGVTIAPAATYDTLKVDRYRRPGARHNLAAACEAHGITLAGAHRAMNDAAATADLFRAQRRGA
jgi:DNA polymerase III epsilon subunit-like protein